MAKMARRHAVRIMKRRINCPPSGRVETKSLDDWETFYVPIALSVKFGETKGIVSVPAVLSISWFTENG